MSVRLSPFTPSRIVEHRIAEAVQGGGEGLGEVAAGGFAEFGGEDFAVALASQDKEGGHGRGVPPG